ncbi:hypothetical protein BDZ91DRAFT_788302 [Kalaharituber pfeilii]|nr:hypothetical protein BDZ91DRAFT_788302 [Kalaharituber pfeilii]
MAEESKLGSKSSSTETTASYMPLRCLPPSRINSAGVSSVSPPHRVRRSPRLTASLPGASLLPLSAGRTGILATKNMASRRNWLAIGGLRTKMGLGGGPSQEKVELIIAAQTLGVGCRPMTDNISAILPCIGIQLPLSVRPDRVDDAGAGRGAGDGGMRAPQFRLSLPLSD